MSVHKIGLVGLGYWGPNLVRAFMNTPGAEIRMVCDNDSDRLNNIRRVYGLPGCQDVAELLHDDEIETMVIATPTATHFELAKAALERGKHVFITKPLTNDPVQADRLVEMAEARGLMLHLDHTFVYTPAVRKLKEVITSDTFGPLNYIDSARINLGLFQHDSNVIWDLAPHDISILSYLIGEPPSHVRAYSNQPLLPPHEHLAYVSLEYPCGLLAHLHLNWLSPVKVRRMIIGGTQNMAIYDDAETTEKIKVFSKGVEIARGSEEIADDRVQYRTGDIQIPFIENREALLIECAEYIEAVTGNTSTVTSGAIGAEIVHICHALQQSLTKNGERLPLYLVRDGAEEMEEVPVVSLAHS